MSDLETLRKNIDTIDEDIIKLLAARQGIVQAIGQLKMEMGVSVVDLGREQALAEFHQSLSVRYALSPEFIKRVFDMIILESRQLQQ